MKKILYIILNGKEYGGSEKHVVDLINNLPSDYDISVIMSKNNKMIDYINYKKCNSIYEINRNNIFVLSKIKRIIKKEKPDIIHAHAARGIVYSRICSSTFVKKGKTKLICTAHGWILDYLKFKNLKEKLFLFKKDIDSVTLAVSKHSMDEMILHGFDKNKMEYVYNGIEVKTYNNLSKIKKNVKNINYIGRFTDQKGINYLMDALLMMKDTNYHFNIYGKGEKEQYIIDFIKKNQIKNVKINGFIPAEQVINILNKTDILLLPSIDEGFPYILVEAISAGVPCIATNVGGVSEIINNENGRLIVPRNAEQIVKSIDDISMKNIEQLSKKCIIDSKKFDISTMIKSIDNIYTKVILNEKK